MRLSEKQLIWLTVGISVSIILVLAILGYFFQLNRLKKASDEIATLEKEFAAIEVQLGEMEKLEQSIRELKQIKEKFEIIIPTKKEVSPEEYIQTLNQLGKESNVVITNAITREPSEMGSSAATPAFSSGGLEQITYVLTVQGEFFNLLTFIWRLETFPRFIKVERFDITPGQEVRGDTTTNQEANIEHIKYYIMNLTITTYTYTEGGL